MFGNAKEPIGRKATGNTWPESVRKTITQARRQGESGAVFHGQCVNCLNRAGNISGKECATAQDAASLRSTIGNRIDIKETNHERRTP